MYKKSESPYEFYNSLNRYLVRSGISLKGISRNNKYLALAGFSRDDSTALEYLRFDFMSSYSSKDIPDYLGGSSVEREEVFSFLKEDKNRTEFFAEYAEASSKKLYKMCNIGRFDFGFGQECFLFKYDRRDKVTNLFSIISIKI